MVFLSGFGLFVLYWVNIVVDDEVVIEEEVDVVVDGEILLFEEDLEVLVGDEESV